MLRFSRRHFRLSDQGRPLWRLQTAVLDQRTAGCASSPTNAPTLCAGPLRGRGLSQTSQVGQTNAASGGLGNPAAPVMFEVISNWTARGAYCDWQPITFSGGFRFPVGTNFIDGVTLFAYGEVKVRGEGRPEVKVIGEGEQRMLPSCSGWPAESDDKFHCSPSPLTFTSP